MTAAVRACVWLGRLRKPAGSLWRPGSVGGPHRRGRLPLLMPGIGASAALDRLGRLMCESTVRHEELAAVGIVLLARPRLGQSAAIERLIPLDELVRAFAASQQRGE